MSGLLRRIKRSRAADAGETPAEGQAAAPEGAPTTAANPAGGGRETAVTAPATAPLPRADPDVPAGLDPAAVRPPTGRRGRLRRRLRYLRRARELMLRDLGGLLYEVHRSGGGEIGAHASVIRTKVDRLTTLDSEAAAIETALGAPRSDAVVFQPGVGGTCGFCGELYGSAARFCSNCGSPTGSAVRATPAHVPVSRPVPAMPRPPAAAPDEPARATEAPTDAPTDATDAPAGATDDPAEAPTDATEAPTEATRGPDDAPTEVPTEATEAPTEATEAPTEATEAPTEDRTEAPADATEAPADATEAPADAKRPGEPGTGDPERNPFAGMSNGHPDEGTPPELSSGDPLATRESRS